MNLDVLTFSRDCPHMQNGLSFSEDRIPRHDLPVAWDLQQRDGTADAGIRLAGALSEGFYSLQLPFGNRH
ncbi:hypothetical protein BaRGS_00022172 [Batillaria attramentaria]|uniref:Uncharacterized protein n=1 Tax=Batillaria attramentaria TaxID=370345 RepID=A0ABD0KH61_9CAEN